MIADRLTTALVTLNESETRSVNLALLLFYALINIESCNSANRTLNPKIPNAADLLNAINALKHFLIDQLVKFFLVVNIFLFHINLIYLYCTNCTNIIYLMIRTIIFCYLE